MLTRDHKKPETPIQFQLSDSPLLGTNSMFTMLEDVYLHREAERHIVHLLLPAAILLQSTDTQRPATLRCKKG